MKHWSDPWGKLPGETKGGHVPLTYDVFIVTSQYKPSEIWYDKDCDAILRRFTVKEIKIPILIDTPTLKMC